MGNKLFTIIGRGYATLFGYTPVLKGTQGAAVSSISSHFVSIGDIMTEGKVSPEQAEFALAKLYEAQLACNSAVAYGWNNGNPASY